MEAKSLKLRRDRKKEIFDFPLLIRQDFEKSVLTEKVEKICLFVEGSLSFIELWWRELGFCAGCVCFLLRFKFFPSPIIVLLFVFELFKCYLR